MASCRQGRHQASNQNSTGFGLKNFFRAPPARSAGKPMEHSYRYWLRFGTRSGCQNFRASFQGFSKTSKRRTEAYRMHVGTDFLKLPPVTGQYWSLFQCSMLGTGGTCDNKIGPGVGLQGFTCVHASWCHWCIELVCPCARVLRYTRGLYHFPIIKCFFPTPLALSSSGEDPSSLTNILWKLSGTHSLCNDCVGHYLAKWALSCPLTRQQFNVQCSPNAQGACKAVVDAYTTSLQPPTAMCE